LERVNVNIDIRQQRVQLRSAYLILNEKIF
jgi:hypothetical protein